MKKLLYISVLLMFSLNMLAQNKLTNALYSLKHNEMEKARILIDAAAIDTLFSDKAATWYYRGYIYKEIFKDSESSDIQSPARDTAVRSFIKALKMPDVEEFRSSIQIGLRFLAGTYYNNAALLFDPENYPFALLSYERFKEIMSIVDTSYDFTEKDINFQLALATVYNEIAMQMPGSEKIYLEKAAEIYRYILTLDSNNVSANYNLGIFYYNQGVEVVNNMDYSMDLYELNAIQDKMIQLFRKSLPYMKKAYDLDPTRKETLEGLQGIYFSLNDKQKADIYKSQLEALEDNSIANPQEEKEKDQ